MKSTVFIVFVAISATSAGTKKTIKRGVLDIHNIPSVGSETHGRKYTEAIVYDSHGVAIQEKSHLYAEDHAHTSAVGPPEAIVETVAPDLSHGRGLDIGHHGGVALDNSVGLAFTDVSVADPGVTLVGPSVGLYGAHGLLGANGIALRSQVQDLGQIIKQHIHVTQNIGVPHLQPYPIPVEQTVAVAVPHPVDVHVDRPYKVLVPQPYEVKVVKDIPYHIEKPVPVPVKVPVKIPVSIPVKVLVPKPVPVKVFKDIPVAVPHTVVVKRPVPVSIHTHLEHLHEHLAHHHGHHHNYIDDFHHHHHH